MNPELLSRWQFAFTISFHYIYPPISMGLGLLLVIMGAMYLRTKDAKWRQLLFFWVKVYGLVFALGVATGIVQEFEFGTNWSVYSRFVGNVFGSLLAAEGIFAFFLEGGFLGLMLFGGNRLGPRLWLMATTLVALGAHFSAIWIVMANSWMQTPSGYVLQDSPSGVMAVMTSFRAVLLNPTFVPRILHVLTSAWLVGASLVLSVSAWYLLRGKHQEMAQASIKVALPVLLVFSILQVALFGSEQAVAVAETQQVKLAAMEGLWQTGPCAPLHLVGWVDEAAQTTTGIAIPCLLSMLAFGSMDAPVQGLTDFSPDLWSPVNLVFQVYHAMINLGFLLIPLALVAVFYYFWGRRLWTTRWVLWLLVISIFITQVATQTGWWTAEFGRQPWIVWDLLRTAEAVSPVLDTGQVLFSLLMFVALYTVLFGLFIYLLNEKIQHGPEPLEENVQVSSLPDRFRDIFGRRVQM